MVTVELEVTRSQYAALQREARARQLSVDFLMQQQLEQLVREQRRR